MLLIGTEDRIRPLPLEFRTFLESIDPGTPQKAEEAKPSDYMRAYQLAFSVNPLSITPTTEGPHESEFLRLHVTTKETNAIVTITVDGDELAEIEVRSLSVDPLHLTSSAKWGRKWVNSFEDGSLSIWSRHDLKVRRLTRLLRSVDIFSFPSSNDIESRPIPIHGSVYRLECLRRNHYHEVVFEAPTQDFSSFDNQFLELLGEFSRTLDKSGIEINIM